MQDFIREPSEEEWARLSVYARRMRYFLNGGRDVPSEAALRLLNARSSGRCMLPKLRDIQCFSAPREHLEQLLPLVVSPVLTNFLLGFNIHSNLDGFQLVPILEALAPAYNSLTEVRIYYPTPHDPQIIHATSNLLLKCNPDKLRDFTVISALSAEAFIHATQLPNLEMFVIRTDMTEVDVPLPTSAFPSLKSLEIDATNTRSPLLQTITHIRSRTLTRLELGFPAATLETFLPATLAALQPGGLHQTLTTLSINPKGDVDLNGAAMRPILFLTQLTNLEIRFFCDQGRCAYKLSDENLEELVTAMPKLRLLSLGSFPCSRPANSTLKSLASVARHCKHLEQLSIHTNVGAIVNGLLQGGYRREDFAPEDPLAVFAGSPLHTIIFGPCPIPNEEQGAMIFVLALLRLFPRLKSVAVFPPGRERDPLWELVDSVVTTYRRIRINIADAGKLTSFLPHTEFAHVLQLLIWRPTEFCPCLPFFSSPVSRVPYVLYSIQIRWNLFVQILGNKHADYAPN